MTNTKKKKKDKRTNLEKEMDRILETMSKLDPLSDEYAKLVTKYDALNEAKSKDESKKKVSADAVMSTVGILASVAGVGLWDFLGHNMSPKLLNLIPKFRGRV